MNLSYKSQRKLVIFLFLLLPITMLAIFSIYPVLQMLKYSFSDWDGISREYNFVGLQNYTNLLGDKETFGLLCHNLTYVISGILILILGLLLAVILNSKIHGRNVFRFIIFMPFVMNSVAVAYMFQFIFDFENGVLNKLLGIFSIEGIKWLGNATLVNFSLSGVSSWQYLGFYMVIFLGGLQAIPKELNEAAKIDGANSWQVFKYITLPGISTIIELAIFLVISGSMKAFELPFILTSGGPLGASDTFVTKTLTFAFNLQSYGPATALGIILLLIVVLFSLIQQKFMSKTGGAYE